MEAILKSQGDIAIIAIKGSLDIEKTQPLRDFCIKYFRDKKVIFNMQDASFVGSTGIQPFIETIRGMDIGGKGLKLVCVKSEFRQFFEHMGLSQLDFHETEESAINSY